MILEALTISLGIFLIVIVLRSVKQLAIAKNEYKKLPAKVAVFFAVWLIYLSVISYSEILADFSLPPRLPLLVVLPILSVFILSLFKKATSDFVAITSVGWLIYLQGFRIIVELIIWGGYNNGMLPLITTFEGYNYDVVIGLTAVPIAYYSKRAKFSGKILVIWNIVGLLILANTVRLFISAAYFPEAIGLSSGEIGTEFIKLPYLLIAGLFMPLAVYIHALSIKQLLMRAS
jgi:hypothetical protein